MNKIKLYLHALENPTNSGFNSRTRKWGRGEEGSSKELVEKLKLFGFLNPKIRPESAGGMNKIITLPNSRVFDLEKDRLTTEDYKCLTGEEVRHIGELKRAILEKIWEEDSKRIFEETGMILHYN